MQKVPVLRPNLNVCNRLPLLSHGDWEILSTRFNTQSFEANWYLVLHTQVKRKLLATTTMQIMQATTRNL